MQQKHGKNYDETEDATRLEIVSLKTIKLYFHVIDIYTSDQFKESLKKIEEHNAKYEKKETTFKMGLNQMSDWTPEEKKSLQGARPQPPPRQ